jgi:hypothetical protein
MKINNALNREFPNQHFWTAIVANMLWINASEVFRYFVVLQSMVRRTFPQIPDVAPMNLGIFMIWGVWDTILIFAATFYFWLIFEKFGTHLRIVFFAATSVWATVFILLWLGMLNMNLATVEMLRAMLPMAWFEMLIAALLTRWAMLRN